MQDLNLDNMTEEEAIDTFLKAHTTFIGPDPEIMVNHGIAPRSAREDEIINSKEWDTNQMSLIRDRLVSNSNECWETMTQIAASPGAKWGDSVAGFWTASGDLSAVSTGGVLGFASITHYALRHINKYWKDDPTIGVNEGDAFMHNDARFGSIHPADFTTFYPVFHEGEMVCWVGCSEHLGENGAIEPGGLTANAESTYGEGLLISPVKIAENGELKRDLVTLFQNMCRDPALMFEDMKARLVVCKALAQSAKEAIAENGVEAFIASLRKSLEDVELEVRNRIREMPDGTVRAVSFGDHTLREEVLYKAQVEIRKKDDSLVFDFSGSTPEFANRTINSALGSTKTVVSGLFSAFIWPDLPRNQATISPIEFVTDNGSALAASYDAPTSISMLTLFPTFTACQVAMAKMLFAIPDIRNQIIAPWYNMINTYVYGGVNQRGQMVASISGDVNGMAGGARDNRDGEHSMAAIFAIMGDLPELEVQEEENPDVSLVGKKIMKDNQGFGKFRGGSGYYWIISPKESPLWGYASIANGSSYPNVTGLFGGYGCGTYPLCKVKDVDVFDLIDDDPTAFSSYNIADIMNNKPFEDATYVAQKAAMPFEFAQRGELYMICQGAGGGYGDVLERDPASVAKDLEDNLISSKVAKEVYGVICNDENYAVDEEETINYRNGIRADRLAKAKPYHEFCEEWSTTRPELPVPYFGSWDNKEEIYVGVNDMPSPASALTPVIMDNPELAKINKLEQENADLRAQLEARG